MFGSTNFKRYQFGNESMDIEEPKISKTGITACLFQRRSSVRWGNDFQLPACGMMADPWHRPAGYNFNIFWLRRKIHVQKNNGNNVYFNDRSAYNLAEFAVGLNPASRTYATNLEDLGKLGFGHHGIGSNYAIGGSVAAPCHIDIIYAEASLYIDGNLIMDKGELMIWW